MKNVQKGDILIAVTTHPDYVVAMNKAIALLLMKWNVVPCGNCFKEMKSLALQAQRMQQKSSATARKLLLMAIKDC